MSYTHDASHANGAFVGESYGVNAPEKVQPGPQGMAHGRATKNVSTLGYTDCGHGCESCGGTGFLGTYEHVDQATGEHLGNQPIPCHVCEGVSNWRPGLVLDPFGGSGTTALVATGHGRDCILIDLDSRNVALARDRIGPLIFEEVHVGETSRSDTPLLAEGGTPE